MTRNERKWRSALNFSSMDALRPYFGILWIPISDVTTYQVGIRNLIIPDDPYSTDYGKHITAATQWIGKTFGRSNLFSFVQWVNEIYIHDGEDRIQEEFWRSILSDLVSEEVINSFRHGEGFKRIIVDKRNATHERDLVLGKIFDEGISDWDQSILKLENCAPNDMITRAQLLVSDNAFAEAWNRESRHIDSEDLNLLYELAHSRSFEPQIPVDQLEFPGLWQINQIGLLPDD